MKTLKIFSGFFLMVFLFMSASGCSHVRTYTVEKERVDQDLTQGNAGYLSGKPATVPTCGERRMTRKTYVAEVEVGMPAGKKKKPVVKKTVAAPQAPQAVSVTPVVTTSSVPAVLKVTTYTVERNDTLQKISQKVYGTMNKWKVIFEANKDKLKTPDRIYAGQILNIPQE